MNESINQLINQPSLAEITRHHGASSLSTTLVQNTHFCSPQPMVFSARWQNNVFNPHGQF
jgi:hypothetical protein